MGGGVGAAGPWGLLGAIVGAVCYVCDSIVSVVLQSGFGLCWEVGGVLGSSRCRVRGSETVPQALGPWGMCRPMFFDNLHRYLVALPT